MKKTAIIAFLLMAHGVNSEPVCKWPQSSHSSCPHIALGPTATYRMPPYYGAIYYDLESNVTEMTATELHPPILKPQRHEYYYIPPRSSCNNPISKVRPTGLCWEGHDYLGVRGYKNTYKPFTVFGFGHDTARSPTSDSYLEKEITPGGNIHYLISSEFTPDGGMGRLAASRNIFKFETTKTDLVIDGHHYPIKVLPTEMSIDKSFPISYMEPTTGVIELNFEYEFLKDCNKASDMYDADEHMLILRNSQNQTETIYHIDGELRITKTSDTLHYEVNTKNSGVNGNNPLVCQGYLKDDIYSDSFEDGIFSSGFDVRPRPYTFKMRFY